MNIHRQTDRLLEAFALGELTSLRQAEVQAHLAQCPQCAARQRRIRALLECADGIGRTSVDERMCQSAEQAVLDTIGANADSQPVPRAASAPILLWRKMTNTPKFRLAAAALIIAAAIGAISLRPDGDSNAPNWWLQPPALVAAEIDHSLQTVQALVHREQTVFVSPYGATHVSGNWSRIYESKDAAREDTYYNDDIVRIRWDIPDGNDLLKYNVSYEFECYTIDRNEDSVLPSDPLARLRFYVNLLEKADRMLENRLFENRQCVGFEISASKYGNNPNEWIDRIWVDIETRLPVRIEKHGRPVTSSPGQTFTFIRDQFEYYAQVPADMFTPQIPEGFVNRTSHEIQKERQAEQEADMIFADVPPDLKKNIAEALKSIETAVFSKGKDTIYASKYAWRIDFADAKGELYMTEWYVVQKDDMADTSRDFNDKTYRVGKTTVNYADRTFVEKTYGPESHPVNPMERIWHPIRFIDRADRILENAFIEGIECFGIELSARKYGTNPDGALHRCWFDLRTKLPVRMELEWPRDDGTIFTQVRDRFQWNPELPTDALVPQIPIDFTLVDPNQM